MRHLTIILLLISNLSLAQTKENFLSSFLLGTELKPENVLEKYNHFDFSNIWTQTKNYEIVGIIGKDYQRIKIKILSVRKAATNPNIYYITGKSNVKGNICNFGGTIILTEIKEAKKLHLGIDNKYKDQGIKSEGVLIATYRLKEDPNQKHSGIFTGKLYSQWYVNAENQIQYDDLTIYADGYLNNAFIGTWTSNSTGSVKTCKWGDYRVPKPKPGFDIGAGAFSPDKKFYDEGWGNY